MSKETQDKIDWLFAQCIAFVLIFMIVAIVGGFVAARILGLPVNVQLFYNLIGNAFFMVLGYVLKSNNSSETKRKGPEV